jgi:hypothetical protein
MATARSYAKRFQPGLIMPAYSMGVYVNLPRDTTRLAACLDYYDTVNTNIAAFLKNKTRTMEFRLENAKEDFVTFWRNIEAQGDQVSALREWDVAYNRSAD